MMPHLIPYRPEHLFSIKPRAEDHGAAKWMSPYDEVELMRHDSFTGVTDDGRVIGSAGAIRLWRGRYEAWAYIDASAGSDLLWITRRTRAFLNDLLERKARRVEANVALSFHNGHRFALACGFEIETEELEGFMPDGEAATRYVRVRP